MNIWNDKLFTQTPTQEEYAVLISQGIIILFNEVL